jgi:DNA modification methylase
MKVRHKQQEACGLKTRSHTSDPAACVSQLPTNRDRRERQGAKPSPHNVPRGERGSGGRARVKHRGIALVSLRKLRPNKRNARTHPQKQIRQIQSNYRRFGWTNPIIVDESNIILAGHGRYEAALQLGLLEVPVIVVAGLSDVEKRALALADNKIAENAGWDRKRLAEELAELANLLPECNLGLEITGFAPAEIDGLLGDLVDPELDPADEVFPPAKTATTKIGDLWELGPHRLLCGDAASAEDVRRLMDAESAAMVITDPPYNLPIRKVQGRGRTKHGDFAQASGEMSPARYTRFLQASLSFAAKYSVDGAIHFVFIDWRHIGELLAAGAQVYSNLKNVVVWVKTNAGQGSFYRSQHELIFVYKSGDGPHINNFELGQHGRSRSNVWTYAGVNTFRAGRLDDLSAHPTVKPLALFADAMRDCSRRGDIVLDPFMGSGTTIMAAERVGRRAYGLELDPLYVDVAVRRWQAYSRRDAVLKGTGETFDEVAALRSKTGGAP